MRPLSRISSPSPRAIRALFRSPASAKETSNPLGTKLPLFTCSTMAQAARCMVSCIRFRR